MYILNSKMFASLLVAFFFAASGSAHAAATTFYFGSLLSASSGYAAPNNFASQPFASLETVNNGNVWTFTLSVNNNLFASFGDRAYIGSMSFDFNPDPVNRPVSSFIGSNVGGVTSVASTNGGATYGLSDIDFGTEFGKGSGARLAQNDYVSWSVSGLSGTSFVNMYIDVKGISGGYSAKYTPQGVTVEQLAALNAEAVRTKTDADTKKVAADAKKVESDAKTVEAERTAVEKVKQEALAAAAERVKQDAIAAAADQATIDALAAEAERVRLEAERCKQVALTAEAERVRVEAEKIQADTECANAAALAAEAERARLEAEYKIAEEESFRRRVIEREHDSSHGGCASLVPEPETYAMLLAGLGLIGFAARRRK